MQQAATDASAPPLSDILPLLLSHTSFHKQPVIVPLLACSKSVRAAVVAHHPSATIPINLGRTAMPASMRHFHPQGADTIPKERAASLGSWVARHGRLMASLEAQLPNKWADTQHITTGLQAAAWGTRPGGALQLRSLDVSHTSPDMLLALSTSHLTSLDLHFMVDDDSLPGAADLLPRFTSLRRLCLHKGATPGVLRSVAAEATGLRCLVLGNSSRLQLAHLVRALPTALQELELPWFSSTFDSVAPAAAAAAEAPAGASRKQVAAAVKAAQRASHDEQQQLMRRVLLLHLGSLTALTRLSSTHGLQLAADDELPPRLAELHLASAASLQPLAGLSLLQRLCCTTVDAFTSCSDLQQLRRLLPALTSLELGFSGRQAPQLLAAAAAGWHGLPLRSLTLFDWHSSPAPDAGPVETELAAALRLVASAAEAAAATAEAVAGGCGGLTRLELVHCTVNDMQGIAASLRCLTSLRSLSLQAFKPATRAGEQQLFGAVAALPNLQELRLAHCHPCAAAIMAHLCSGSGPRLTALAFERIRDCHCSRDPPAAQAATADQARANQGAPANGAEDGWPADPGIGAAASAAPGRGCRTLDALLQRPGLLSLSLQDTTIVTDAHVMLVVEQQQQLTAINLRGCPSSVPGEWLFELPHLQSLQLPDE